MFIFCAADKKTIDANVLENVVNGFRSASCTQDECSLMLCFQEWFDALPETKNIRIGTYELVTTDADAIDGAYRFRCFVQLIEERNDRCFVGNGHVEPGNGGIVF